MQLHEPRRLLVAVSESYIATTVGLLECRCTAEEWAIWFKTVFITPSVITLVESSVIRLTALNCLQ